MLLGIPESRSVPQDIVREPLTPTASANQQQWPSMTGAVGLRQAASCDGRLPFQSRPVLDNTYARPRQDASDFPAEIDASRV